MLAMLLGTTAIVALSFPYVVRPLIRMTLERREVPAVYEVGRMTRLVLEGCAGGISGLGATKLPAPPRF
jgi:hypothetical protein